LVEVLAEVEDLVGGEGAEAGAAGFGAIAGVFGDGGVAAGFGDAGGVKEGDRGHALFVAGQGGGELEEALSADEVGLEGRAKGVAAPGGAGRGAACAAQERVVDGYAKGGIRGQRGRDGASDDGEEGVDRQAFSREEAIGGGPVGELGTAGGEEARHGMATEAKE